ncbi:uncharacterized protein LOC119671564 [Teleopsis dalmanni]|uniref:uncharacterized protein LOC119671564 n=1 Tax=Teleopsis dalmanni TaxID=139649 RepID=UPI0018CF7272|nr:uncharacterized protein LOC119671564 [Teleopsis dalmanni]
MENSDKETADCWTKDETNMLINEFKNHACLINPSDPKFANKAARTDAYNKIIKKLKSIKPNVNVKKIKKKLSTLQNQICHEKVMEANCKRRGIEYKPKLWCYDKLDFLKNNSHIRQSYSSLQDTSDQIDVHFDECGNLDLDETEMFEKEFLKEYDGAIATENKKKRSTHIFNLKTNVNKKRCCKEEIFCNYLSSELRRIQLEDTFDDLKLEILRLVRQAIKNESLRCI